MKAWINANATIELTDQPVPSPRPGQVAIDVRAAGCNRADLFARVGTYRVGTRANPIAGGEAAGEVIAIGEGVTRWALGDRVMGMLQGALAEVAVIDARIAMAVPTGLSWVHAAALPVALCTEHDAIVTNAQVEPGESVLVTGAASGVGIVACQIARWAGAEVIATTRSEERAAQLRALAIADRVVVTDGPATDFRPGVDRERGIDVVIDHVGGDLLMPALQAMALGGRYVSVGRLGGMVTPIDLDLLARKRLHLIGVTFRTRNPDQFAAISAAVERDLYEPVGAGKIGPPVSATFDFDHALAAQELMAADGHLGKIVVTVP